jgi:asparagine synthase (glutamine-hydrolysing)
MRATVARGIALRRPPAFREKLGDMARTDGSLLALYLQRRRAMSDRQLDRLGLRASELRLDESFLPAESLEGLADDDDADAVASISQYESRFYQGNMLLRDADANGMAHGLEIRVPLLDQRVADYMYQVPGSVRLPRPINDKHLLRAAFPELLRSEILGQEKRGFALPLARWMLGPLRDLCESGLRSVKSLGILDAGGVDEIWQTFAAHPQTPIWSRAFVLCVLGIYAEKNSCRRN